MYKIIRVFSFLLLSCMSLQAQSYLEHLSINSEYLSEERVLTISLPAEYEISKKTYPVLYVLDGEYIFSYARGTVDFLSNDFSYSPKMIVVSIPNTNRFRDMYVTLNQEDSFMNFVRFLEKEVIPFIATNYRTNGFEVLYGWSSGSAICTYLLAAQPGLLDGYILTGSGIGRRSGAFLKEQLSGNPFKQKTFLYVNVEDEGPRKAAFQKYEALIDSIKPDNLASKFEVAPNTGHVEAMSVGLYRGLKFIFADFYITDQITLQGKEAIKNYYKYVTEQYGFDYDIPMGAINESASVLMNNDRKTTATELLLYGTRLHPYAATLYGSLGEIHQSAGESVLAKRYLEKALELSAGNKAEVLKYRALLKGLQK